MAVRRASIDDEAKLSERNSRSSRDDSRPTQVEDLDFANAPLERVAAAVRPVMERDGMEYELDPSSLLEQAAKVQSRARSGLPLEDRDSLGSDAARLGVTGSTLAKSEKMRFGGEDRAIVPSPGTQHPWRNIASMGTSDCTAFKMINEYTAVTAAHCMHTGSAWKARKSLSFAASTTYGFPYGTVSSTCYDRTVNGNYNGSNSNQEYDYAVIRLRSNTASCGSTYPLGKFGYQGVSNGTSGINGVVAGYPAKSDEFGHVPPGAWVIPEMFWHQHGGGYTNCCGFYNGHVWYHNDTSDGQSGAPYWTFDGTSHNVRAIHYGHNTFANDFNGGVRIKDSVINFLTSYAGY